MQKTYLGTRKITQKGKRGYVLQIPPWWVTINNLKLGDKLHFYAEGDTVYFSAHRLEEGED